MLCMIGLSMVKLKVRRKARTLIAGFTLRLAVHLVLCQCSALDMELVRGKLNQGLSGNFSEDRGAFSPRAEAKMTGPLHDPSCAHIQKSFEGQVSRRRKSDDA